MVPMIMPNAPGAAISMRFGLQAQTKRSRQRVPLALMLCTPTRLIQMGYADVLSGGTESVMSPVVWPGFKYDCFVLIGKIYALDKDRDGFMMTEGSATRFEK